VGYEEGGQLTEQVRRKPYSVVLLDEIEKAHPEVFNILLQVLDDGRLTDNKGRTVNFKNTIIIMTSNIGAPFILEKSKQITNENQEKIYDEIKQDVLMQLQQQMRPEFLNRIDDIIVFHYLNEKEILNIVKLQLQLVNNKLRQQGIMVEVSDAAMKYIANKGYVPEYGARPLKRLIQNEIVNELAKKLIAGELKKDKTVLIDISGEEIVFK
jgi:ATP-dependent Clp protease ATP-binding subunit ClpB